MRTPVTLKIKFKSANLDQFIERYSVDVSRGGIFIRTKEPLPVGTQLKFEFQLQDSQPLISGEGTVVWIREHDPTRTGVAPGMGVRFDRLAPQSQQVLDRILSEKQRLDAGLEGKFSAPRAPSGATAPSLPSTGAIDGRARPSPRLGGERTPLSDALPFVGQKQDEHEPFGPRESTKVMLPEQTEELKQKARQGSAGAPARAPAPVSLLGKPTPPPGSREPQPSGLTVTLQPPPTMAQQPAASSDKAADAVVAAPSAPTEPGKRDPTLPYMPPAARDKPPAGVATDSGPTSASEAPLKAEPTVPAPIPDEPVEERAGEGNGRSREVVPKSDWFSGVESSGTGSEPVQVEGGGRAGRAAAARAHDSTENVPAISGARKRSAAPVVVLLLLGVGGLGGYLYWTAQHEAQHEATPPVATKPPEPREPAVKPPSAEAPPALAAGEKPAAETAEKAETPPGTKVAAATPSKPAAGAGLSVAVTSTPPGAQVLLDAKQQPGVTPTKLEGLEAGKLYQIKLALKGYKPYETTLKAKAGLDVAATLVALPRWLFVQSTPPGAAVFVDGQRMGVTPTTLKEIDFTKPHKVELKKLGFEGVGRDVTAGDEWREKADHSELALAVELVKQGAAAEKTEKPAPAEKPAVVRKLKRPRPAKPAEGAVEQPAASEGGETPAAEKEKPAPEKEKPPAPPEDKPDLKTPDWLKK